MDAREFYGKVTSHPDLEWLGAREGGPTGGGWTAGNGKAVRGEVLIGHRRTGARKAVDIRAVLENPWEELEAVLTGRRAPRIMTHLTRIVGYFSRVQNWNRSKVAELRERHIGDYAVAEPAIPRAGTISPPSVVPVVDEELSAVA